MNDMKRLPLITSFILFIALCVSAAYWSMQLYKPAARPVAALPVTDLPAPDPESAASLFGGHSTAVVASNFQLKGVVMASNPAESVAILSANSKPAHAIKANTEVVPGVMLKEVYRGYVLLSEGGVIKRVEMSANAMRRNDAVTVPAINSPASPPVNQPGLSNRSNPNHPNHPQNPQGNKNHLPGSGSRQPS